jgi:trk system potassium uptake protein TrkA
VSVHDLEEATGTRVAYLTRYGDGILVTTHSVLQENDVLHLLVANDDLERVERVLTRAPKTEGQVH